MECHTLLIRQRFKQEDKDNAIMGVQHSCNKNEKKRTVKSRRQPKGIMFQHQHG